MHHEGMHGCLDEVQIPWQEQDTVNLEVQFSYQLQRFVDYRGANFGAGETVFVVLQ